MRLVLLASAIMSLVAVTSPASAIQLEARPGIEGGIKVQPDFTACAHLVFRPGTTFVGEFTAVGQLQGPGTKVGTVRGAVPISSNSGSWSGCIPGSYLGAAFGDGKFTLSGHASTDYVEIKQCVVNAGAINCV